MNEVRQGPPECEERSELAAGSDGTEGGGWDPTLAVLGAVLGKTDGR